MVARRSPVLSLIGVLLFMSMAVSCAFAEANVSVVVNPSEGQMSDEFALGIEVQGADPGDLALPDLEISQDFRVRYIGPSTQLSIINGSMSSSVTFQYSLRPMREGTLATPKGTIRVGGALVVIPTREVRVSKAVPIQPRDDVGINQQIDLPEVYIGQQLRHELEIYGAENIYNPTLGDLVFDGFWKLSFGPEQQGRRYHSGHLTSTVTIKNALFPLRTGTLALPPRAVQGQIRERQLRRNPFGSSLFDDLFYGGQLRQVTLSSDPLTVLVKPLPPPPPSFPLWRNTSGAVLAELVGGTSLKVEFDSAPVPLGEGKKVTVIVTSLGNLSAVRSVDLTPPPGIKVYQSSPAERVHDSGDRLVIERRFEITLLPTRVGTFVVPPLRLGFFDPGSEQHRIATSAEIRFEAVPGINGETSAGTEADIVDTVAPEAAPVGAEPTPTIAPYSEPGVWLRLRERYSFGFVALGLLGAALVYGAILFLRRSRNERRPHRVLAAAKTVGELNVSFGQLLEQRTGNIDTAVSASYLDALLRTRGVNPEERAILVEMYQELSSLMKLNPNAPVPSRLRDLAVELRFG